MFCSINRLKYIQCAMIQNRDIENPHSGGAGTTPLFKHFCWKEYWNDYQNTCQLIFYCWTNWLIVSVLVFSAHTMLHSLQWHVSVTEHLCRFDLIIKSEVCVSALIPSFCCLFLLLPSPDVTFCHVELRCQLIYLLFQGPIWELLKLKAVVIHVVYFCVFNSVSMA